MIVSDAAKTPIFYRSADTRVVPIEGVYSVIEVKANLNRQELERTFENMKSVRALRNTAYVPQTGAVIYTRTMYGQEW